MRVVRPPCFTAAVAATAVRFGRRLTAAAVKVRRTRARPDAQR